MAAVIGAVIGTSRWVHGWPHGLPQWGLRVCPEGGPWRSGILATMEVQDIVYTIILLLMVALIYSYAAACWLC